MKLKLADDLALPLDAVTQTFLIVGKRGSGKSNTAARFVEQLYAAKLPFVVLDPVDTWWGLKAGADGRRGLDVYVFGGSHKDLPLEAHGGALLAEVLCEHRIPMVLSVKHLSGKERSAFMVAFAQTLFQKWAGGPLHVVLEEAHELAPQMAGSRASNNQDNEAAMLGAFKRLWKLGRASGIGGSAITQRPASLSKDITTQSETLVAHRTIGPQDVKAIGEWVRYHGEREDLLAELPSLPTGEAFVWAPEFPEGKPIGLQRTAILRRETYDSASTPKVGERRVEPKELAPVDLERLRTKMAATIEKAKSEDPRELRRRVAELELKLKAAASQPSAKPEAKVVEKPVITDAQIATLDAAIGRLEKTIDRAAELLAKPVAGVRERLGELAGAVKSVRQPPLPIAPARAAAPSSGIRPPARPSSAIRQPPPLFRDPVVSDGLTEPEQRILDSLAWWEAAGVPVSSREQTAFVARYSVNGHFNNTLGGLRTKELVEYPRGNAVALTVAGRGLARAPEAAPTRAELIRRVTDILRDEPPRRLFLALVDADERELSREDLAERCGYTVNGHFNNTLGRLRTLGLVTYPRGNHVALSDLFEALPYPDLSRS